MATIVSPVFRGCVRDPRGRKRKRKRKEETFVGLDGWAGELVVDEAREAVDALFADDLVRDSQLDIDDGGERGADDEGQKDGRKDRELHPSLPKIRKMKVKVKER